MLPRVNYQQVTIMSPIKIQMENKHVVYKRSFKGTGTWGMRSHMTSELRPSFLSRPCFTHFGWPCTCRLTGRGAIHPQPVRSHTKVEVEPTHEGDWVTDTLHQTFIHKAEYTVCIFHVYAEWTLLWFCCCCFLRTSVHHTNFYCRSVGSIDISCQHR